MTDEPMIFDGQEPEPPTKPYPYATVCGAGKNRSRRPFNYTLAAMVILSGLALACLIWGK